LNAARASLKTHKSGSNNKKLDLKVRGKAKRKFKQKAMQQNEIKTGHWSKKRHATK